MSSILRRIFGRNKNGGTEAVFPSENFSVLEGTLANGCPMIGSFNMAYKNYELKSSFPWCLKLGIGLDEGNLYDNGLPLGDESSVAYRMEDALVYEIKNRTTAHYIGHLFNDSFLDVYVHLEDPEPVHQYLQDLITREDHARGFGYEIKEDPEWAEVGQFMN